MNPGGRKSGTRTVFSVSDAIKEETSKLLQLVKENGDFGTRKQESLKALVRYIHLGAIPSSLSPYLAVI